MTEKTEKERQLRDQINEHNIELDSHIDYTIDELGNFLELAHDIIYLMKNIDDYLVNKRPYLQPERLREYAEEIVSLYDRHNFEGVYNKFFHDTWQTLESLAKTRKGLEDDYYEIKSDIETEVENDRV